MSDYYQNYRSGNRPLRTYESGVHNPQDRQNPNYRRKNPNQRRSEVGEQLEALLRDLLPVLSKTIESITDYQRRLTDEVENKARAEERKVAALKAIAASLRKHLAGDMEIEEGLPPVMAIESEEGAAVEPPVSSGEMTLEKIVQIIHEMCDLGSTYNEIAQYLENKNIPTFSGRGKWHAQTIHRLYKEA
ncbi:MAG: recombinase family protein [Desulfobacterales bacterium]|nr:recombinase family protein [Desulfobacterales bacterium]MDD3081311.1 recombinase family protein [Desulfobacterales bacterium]MDD3950696.1 recombinase family protein [Desulfobacterales bacterium]MDD4464891.1 recombinase family protein [Desulfobacterales bacterium]